MFNSYPQNQEYPSDILVISMVMELPSGKLT